MKRESMAGGLGALAFGILPLVAMGIANPPGGNYKVSDITSFLAKGHRPAVFLSAYLMVIAGAGLLLLLSRLREAVGDGARERVFWGFSVASVAAWVVGYALAISPALALAFSGGHLKTLSAPVVYALSEAGFAAMYGGGGILLGCALISFVVGRVAVAAWLRWATAVAAVAALAAIAWFPFFLVYLWAIVVGVVILAGARERAPETAAQAA